MLLRIHVILFIWCFPLFCWAQSKDVLIFRYQNVLEKASSFSTGWRDELYGVIRAHVGAVLDSEESVVGGYGDDVVQEIALGLMSQVANQRYNDGESLYEAVRSEISSIGSGIILNYYHGFEESPNHQATNVVTTDIISNAEFKLFFQKLTRDFPDEQRKLLQLFIFEGYDPRELREAFHLKSSQVHPRLNSALRALEKAIRLSGCKEFLNPRLRNKTSSLRGDGPVQLSFYYGRWKYLDHLILKWAIREKK